MWDARARARRWFVFTIWIGLAAVCAYIDYSRQRTVALPIFLVGSVAIFYFAVRKMSPSRFKFELLNHGSKGIRSALGFEVHLTSNGIEYREGDRTLLLRHFGDEQPVQVFGLSLPSNAKWAAPYDQEPIPEDKKKRILRAVIAAIGYLQGATMSRR
jgi:hypothetical protein